MWIASRVPRVDGPTRLQNREVARAGTADGGVALTRLGRRRLDITRRVDGRDLENAMGSSKDCRLEKVGWVSALNLDRAVGVRDFLETAAVVL